jgi:hypothetical protein
VPPPHVAARSQEYEGLRMVFYGLLWCCILAQIVAYVFVYRRVRGMAERMKTGGGGGSGNGGGGDCAHAHSHAGAAAHRRQARMDRFLRSLILYPAILMLCWASATLNRTYEAITGDMVFGLFMAQVATVRLQGFLNSLA